MGEFYSKTVVLIFSPRFQLKFILNEELIVTTTGLSHSYISISTGPGLVDSILEKPIELEDLTRI